ncbi:hypothetical protein PoB_002342300 [Plakobranchus ocellatus]|uniref:Uncharacterized protein n=1 Tax=Plakobranchus ocellatus TaxID=259542 RepID=A0AAV3ZQ03_9GAST|nr:hypothetical protein PoB_002342300 [Plakobranchus ocellatus]
MEDTKFCDKTDDRGGKRWTGALGHLVTLICFYIVCLGWRSRTGCQRQGSKSDKRVRADLKAPLLFTVPPTPHLSSGRGWLFAELVVHQAIGGVRLNNNANRIDLQAELVVHQAIGGFRLINNANRIDLQAELVVHQAIGGFRLNNNANRIDLQAELVVHQATGGVRLNNNANRTDLQAELVVHQPTGGESPPL